jgi:7-cyano-7-deazaguanine synthase
MLHTVLLSGGIDSAAAAAASVSGADEVRSLFVDYGQAAAAYEREAAAVLAAHLGFEHTELEFKGMGIGNGEIPGRNALLVCTALTASRGAAGAIVLGIHGGTSYRDCSPAFVDVLQDLLDFHSDGAVRLLAPFIEMRKPEVFDLAVHYGIPLHMTRSCEAAAERPCGHCRSCKDLEVIGASR